ncbi:hybrid sensor histidine kinase/response regulator [Pseudomonas soli]|uniref:histidine kinase n=1 Tax=Pseudomonas soli TaxID=1306993 RepID=A0A2V4HR64_9PSED|nr:hybrid sensor histidine kinase/response regulator [Pseudomonas soli]PYB80518.1 hybrid sensor histidine kinase/response regulator [Pseudomonas soli]
MKHVNMRLDKLAVSSQGLNKALLLLTGLLLVLSSTCYWAVSRLLDAQQERLEFHFARIVEILHENEVFLYNMANGDWRSRLPLLNPGHSVSVMQTEYVGNQILLKAKAFEMSLPFSMAHASGGNTEDEQRTLALGVQMTEYYGAFWAGSFYASPQLFVLTHDGDISLAIPAVDNPRQQLPLTPDQYFTVAKRLTDYRTGQNLLSDHRVRWSRAPSRLYHDRRSIVAMVDLDNALLPADIIQSPMTLAAVVDTEQVDEFERVLRLSDYNQFTLVSPDGALVLGDLNTDNAAPVGLSFNRQGLCFKMISATGDRWTGLYAITYQDFLRYAKRPLLGLALTFTAAILIGIWISHWYKSHIVLPAQQAQDRLLENAAFNRIILQSAPVGLCVVRRSDCLLLLYNQLAVDLGVIQAVIELLEEHEGEQEPGEMCLLVNSRYLHVVYVATRYEGQDVYLCSCSDITLHVDQSLILNQAHRKATAANEAKTVFLATMSHEIRTPLYGLVGNLELLSLTNMSERQRQYLEIIQSSSNVLFQLISNVLDVSKIESGQMPLEEAPLDPAQLVHDAVIGFSATARKKGLGIEAEIDPRVPRQILGDAVRLRQILHNLLGNAIKFTESGLIRLRLTVQDRSTGSVLLQWQVTDTGIGIPESAMDKLFNPFYQVAGVPSGSGAGLGLSICKRLSDLMGGNIRVVSEPGLGSSFSLFITLAVVDTAPPPPLMTLAAADADAPCLNMRVLVAEDNLVSQAVLREQLEALGAQPTVVPDGKRALDIWHTQTFDVVITDINMPRLNGYELAKALRERGVNVPIIGITANAMREEEQRCLAVGMSAWVVKPLSMDMLRQALVAHCRKANGLLITTPPPTLKDDQEGWIELSQAMRQLMSKTLVTDIAHIEQGLSDMDAIVLRQRLHSLSGALASVNAQTLHIFCQQLEGAIYDGPLTTALVQQIRALCVRLAAVAKCLSD